MKDKILDLNKTVYELYTADSGIAKILAEVGFVDITKPGMLATAGRFMTVARVRHSKKSILKPSNRLL